MALAAASASGPKSWRQTNFSPSTATPHSNHVLLRGVPAEAMDGHGVQKFVGENNAAQPGDGRRVASDRSLRSSD